MSSALEQRTDQADNNNVPGASATSPEPQRQNRKRKIMIPALITGGAIIGGALYLNSSSDEGTPLSPTPVQSTPETLPSTAEQGGAISADGKTITISGGETRPVAAEYKVQLINATTDQGKAEQLMHNRECVINAASISVQNACIEAITGLPITSSDKNVQTLLGYRDRANTYNEGRPQGSNYQEYFTDVQALGSSQSGDDRTVITISHGTVDTSSRILPTIVNEYELLQLDNGASILSDRNNIQ